MESLVAVSLSKVTLLGRAVPFRLKMANVFVDTMHCHWKKQTSQSVKSHTENMPYSDILLESNFKRSNFGLK